MVYGKYSTIRTSLSTTEMSEPRIEKAASFECLQTFTDLRMYSTSDKRLKSQRTGTTEVQKSRGPRGPERIVGIKISASRDSVICLGLRIRIYCNSLVLQHNYPMQIRDTIRIPQKKSIQKTCLFTLN
jgi:hypothetical protein